jgi:NADH-quinone oxidoreductase subunit J
MRAVFLVSSAIALVSTALAISQPKAIHALLWLIASLLALSVVFASVGAPLAAGLEIIVYAGAIMVLFLFAVMLLNVHAPDELASGVRASVPALILAAAMGATLLAEMIAAILGARPGVVRPTAVDSLAVGTSLFGPYLIAVELASFLLLVGLVGAFHLGRGGPDAEGSL